MSPRYVVLPDVDALERARALAARAGRPVVDEPVGAKPGTTYVAHVADEEAAQRAVLAALDGADLLLCCTADDETTDRLLDDLGRLGTVHHESVSLTTEQVALLTRLHTGQSLGAAAAAEHLSRRTADRRLAEARAALGVRTTAEALVAAGRLGLLDAAGDR